jgi:hypothetical protein
VVILQWCRNPAVAASLAARRRKVVLRRMAAAVVDSLAKAVQLADNSRLGSRYFTCSRRIGKRRLRRSILRKPVYGN